MPKFKLTLTELSAPIAPQIEMKPGELAEGAAFGYSVAPERIVYTQTFDDLNVAALIRELNKPARRTRRAAVGSTRAAH
jgi:hypothetical protein